MKAVAICDDDKDDLNASVQILRRFADESAFDIQINLFQDVNACVNEASRFNVVFMDIEFEEGPLGIDAVARINEIAPYCQVVYLTNYLHYSIDVYQTDHVWYVLKSQLAERLPEIFQKLALIEESRRASVVITTKGDNAVVNVPCTSIRYLERHERITRVVTRDTTYVVREKLPELIARLPEMTFARCQNSYVVNLTRVREIHASDLLLDDGTRILISRSYSKRFRKQYLLWAEAWTV